MVRTQKRSQLAERLESKFTKRAHAEIEKMVAGSRVCTRYMARNDLHEVEAGGVAYTVNMNDKTCGCRKWQMTGIPCIHAASVIIGKKQKVDDYVDKCYTTEMWRLTYKDGIKPVQGELLWPKQNRVGVLPPPWRRRPPGRPSNYERRKGLYETQQPKQRMTKEGRVMTCSNCRQDGHNKTTCTNPRVDAPPKKARGRPRKTDGQTAQVPAYGASQASQSQASHGEPSQANWQAWPSQSSQGFQGGGACDAWPSQTYQGFQGGVGIQGGGAWEAWPSQTYVGSQGGV